jgi:hypothetical protein
MLFLAGAAPAQPPRGFTAFEVAQPPADLPLIPVPGPNPPPPPFVPGGPVGEYEPGYLYLPEPGPQFARHAPVVGELWRVSVSAELAWLSTAPLPGALRLTPKDAFGRRVPGLILPTDGRGSDAFQSGFGLNVARRLGEKGAVEASLFLLPDGTRRLDGFAPGSLVSFGDPGRDAPLFVRFPPGFDGFGTTFPATLSTTFVGADVNYKHAVLLTETARVDVLAGYRFAYLSDELYLGEQPAGGGDAYRQNRLQAESTFHGGQLGVAVGLDRGVWYTDGVVKVAYGAVTTGVNASGAFASTRPRPLLGYDTRGAVLPTVSWKVGYRVSDHGALFASYSFQYLDRVARLGDAFCPCGGRSDLWVNSLGLGLEWKF